VLGKLLGFRAEPRRDNNGFLINTYLIGLGVKYGYLLQTYLFFPAYEIYAQAVVLV
jgi:hypothetical protein